MAGPSVALGSILAAAAAAAAEDGAGGGALLCTLPSDIRFCGYSMPARDVAGPGAAFSGGPTLPYGAPLAVSRDGSAKSLPPPVAITASLNA